MEDPLSLEDPELLDSLLELELDESLPVELLPLDEPVSVVAPVVACAGWQRPSSHTWVASQHSDASRHHSAA